MLLSYNKNKMNMEAANKDNETEYKPIFKTDEYWPVGWRQSFQRLHFTDVEDLWWRAEDFVGETRWKGSSYDLEGCFFS